MKKNNLYFIALLSLSMGCTPEKPKEHQEPVVVKQVRDTVIAPVVEPDTSYIEHVFKGYDLVNIKHLDSTILVDLRYSDTNNFLKRNLYDGLRNAYFNCETAIKICSAQTFLKDTNKQYSLVILDAARPHHIQQIMWDSLDMDPYFKHCYLSPPYERSMHNYGCAIDVSIMDLSLKKLLDMGTDYDFFGKLSQPFFEEQYLASGELSKEAYENRKLLRTVMARAGMKSINSEWWHFSSCSKEEAEKKYELIK